MAKKINTPDVTGDTAVAVPDPGVKKKFPFGRIEGILFFDVYDGNMQGDPDADNEQRIDSHGHAFMTADGFNRKVRDFIVDHPEEFPDQDTMGIHVVRDSVLSKNISDVANSLNATQKGSKKAVDGGQIRDQLCKKYFDNRAFGNVFSYKGLHVPSARGPVKIGIARSLDVPHGMKTITIAPTVVSSESQSENQSGRNQTLGSRSFMEYCAFQVRFDVNAGDAAKTGFTEKDFENFLHAVEHMFYHFNSGSRVTRFRGGVVFRHTSPLGDAGCKNPTGEANDYGAVKVDRKTANPSKWSDYDISVSRGTIPKSVRIQVLGDVRDLTSAA